MKHKIRKLSRRIDANIVIGIVSIILALVALILAFQANNLSERSLIISRAQFEASSNSPISLDENFVFHVSNPKIKTEVLWCELINEPKWGEFTPFIQLLTDSSMKNEMFGNSESSKKELLIFAFQNHYVAENQSNSFVSQQNIPIISNSPAEHEFSYPVKIRTHAILREESVYYHSVQDYEARFEFKTINGKITDIKLYYWNFINSIIFERFENTPDFEKFDNELTKRRDMLSSLNDN